MSTLNIKLDKVKLSISDTSVCIVNSFNVIDKKEKEDIIDVIFSNSGISQYRTKKSILNEWVVHNWCYKKGIFKERTKNTDLEFKQKFILKISYSILGKILKA